MKTKRCEVKACGKPFVKQRMGQKICSPGCAYALVLQDKSKARNKETRGNLMKFKQNQISEWHNAQNTWSSAYWFHRWVRLVRDVMDPCISCGRPKVTQWHAGHYRTKAAAGQLRYHPDNVHKQCSQCNKEHSGNIGEYRIHLMAKIGLPRVVALENNNEQHRWTIEELTNIRNCYRDRCKEAA